MTGYTGLAARQMQEQIRKMIITNAVMEGEELPSVRELASKLAVNPQTVFFACEELVQEGYLCRTEDGAFLAASREQILNRQRMELFLEFDHVVKGLSGLSVGVEELTKRLTEVAGGYGELDRSK